MYDNLVITNNIYMIIVKIVKICLLMTVFLFLVGCYNNIEKKEFFPKNPTLYIFNFDKKTIFKTIKIIFDIEYGVKNPFGLFDSNGFDTGFYISPIYSKTGDLEYIKVIPFSPWISDVYYYNGKKTTLNGEFVIYLKKINNYKTKVLIKPLTLKAFSGSHLFTFTGGHGGAKRIKVSSTTIEEYIFISRIGTYLGVKMPKIKIP